MSTGCGAASVAAPPSAPTPLLSHPAPDFQRTALDGSPVASETLRGHVVVIDFFAEHCAPCARSLPALEALHREMPAVAVLGISEDDDAGGARRVVGVHGLSFPVVHDAAHAVGGRYRVTELPATFVVDARGVVRWSGHVEDEGALRAIVEAAR